MNMSETNNYPFWPGWETVRLIGRGSFGSVYEIEREMLGEKEKAALKVITIPQSDSDIEELYGEGYDDESITSTFKNYLKSIVAEYSLMRKMNGSANVVNCDDVRYVQHDDGFGWDIFIKMELLTPLTKAIGKDVTDEQVIRIGMDICKALILCRKHSIIHRDIKPANIFVSDNGDYKLGDFGIAKTVEKTSGGTKIGTYEYMAPEVYHDQPYGSTADIYSFGMVLYWLLNERRTPFLQMPPALPTGSEKEQARKRRFGGEAIPAPAHGSQELKRIVLKACAFNPADRWQTAEDMLEALENIGAPKRTYAHIPATEGEPEEATVGESRCPRKSEEKMTIPVDKAIVNAPGLSSTSEAAKQGPAAYSGRTVEEEGTTGAFDAFAAVSKVTKVPDEDATVSVFRKQKNAPNGFDATVKSGDNKEKKPEQAPEPGKQTEPLKVPNPAVKLNKKRRWLWAALLILAAVIGLVAFISSRKTESPKTAPAEASAEAPVTTPATTPTASPTEVPTASPSPTAEPTAFGKCGDNCTWYLNSDGVLIIEGSGPMESYTSIAEIPWNTNFDKITSAVIENGVTNIGGRAFYGCTNLESISIPDSVNSIKAHAFTDCASLTTVVIPNSVTKISDEVFYNCTGLTTIAIPDSVTNIGYRMFYKCSSLKSIIIPSSVTSIVKSAFYGCSSLKDVYYTGSKEQWKAISIGNSGNAPLKKAAIHYNS